MSNGAKILMWRSAQNPIIPLDHILNSKHDTELLTLQLIHAALKPFLLWHTIFDSAKNLCHNVTGFSKRLHNIYGSKKIIIFMNRRRSSSVTIRDVAQKAGVSVATVSRYINRSVPVSTEVAERIRKAI